MAEKGVCKTPVRFIVLDVLKPHKPNLVDFARSLCELQYFDSVNLTVYAVDERTESIKMTVAGDDIDFEKVKALIEDNGGAVHSIDKVIVGMKPYFDTGGRKGD